MARAEIEDRFLKFNKEGMDERRFRNVKNTIEGLINNEIGKAQSLLIVKSEALTGTSIKSQQVAYNTPQEYKIPPPTPNKPEFNGLINAKKDIADAINKRNAAL
jgi:hypothetical protein